MILRLEGKSRGAGAHVSGFKPEGIIRFSDLVATGAAGESELSNGADKKYTTEAVYDIGKASTALFSNHLSAIRLISSRVRSDVVYMFATGFELSDNDTINFKSYPLFSISVLTRGDSKLNNVLKASLVSVPVPNSGSNSTVFGVELEFQVLGVECRRTALTSQALESNGRHNLTVTVAKKEGGTLLSVDIDCKATTSLALPFELDPLPFVNTILMVGTSTPYATYNVLNGRFKGYLYNPMLVFGEPLTKYAHFCSSEYGVIGSLMRFEHDYSENPTSDNNVLDEIMEYELKLRYRQEEGCLDYRNYYEKQSWISDQSKMCTCDGPDIRCFDHYSPIDVC